MLDIFDRTHWALCSLLTSLLRVTGEMLTLVPGCMTGMFLSVRCSVTFSQLRRKQKQARAWRQRRKSCSSLTREAFIRSPALVCFDLLSHELFVGRLCSLLSHRHQLDQLRPEDAGKQLSQINLPSVIASFIRTLHPQKNKSKEESVCYSTAHPRTGPWPQTVSFFLHSWQSVPWQPKNSFKKSRND